jgi:hypothetical protein
MFVCPLPSAPLLMALRADAKRHQHVDSAEAVESGLDRRSSVGRAGDVQRDDEHVLGLADRRVDGTFLSVIPPL